MATGNIIMVDVYLRRYGTQLIFFIINWNNTCFSKNLFTQFETIVLYAKLFLIKLFTPNRTKGVFAIQVVLR